MNINRLTQGSLSLVVASAVLSLSGFQAGAQTYTLAARNTSLQVNLDGSSGGLTDWTINGVNGLQSQWYYYSIGSGTLHSIDTISAWTPPSTIPGNSPSLTEVYSNSSVVVQTAYTLQSRPIGSTSATLGTALAVQNSSGADEVIHFYQYSHFGVGGGTSGQLVNFPSGSAPYTVNQSDIFNGATLTGQFNAGLTTVGFAAGLYDGTQLGLRNGNLAPTFSDNPQSVGAGDVDFAYEFTEDLAAGGSFTLSESQVVVVPEPSSLALISVGALALVGYSGRRLAGLQKSWRKS
jgi:hypothetical protein